MVIDFHTHTFPEKIAAKALQSLRDKCHTKTFTEGTEEALVLSMERAGVDYSVSLPVATRPGQAAGINDRVIAAHFANPRGKMIYFGAAHPADGDWKEQLERLAEAGVRGIKIHPPYQLTDIDDPAYARILNRAGELGLVVVTHAGLDVGLPGYEQSTPEKIARCLKQVGPVKLVCAHMGSWNGWDRVCECLGGTSAYIDTSFALGKMTPAGDGYAWTDEGLRMMTGEAFVRLVRDFGSDRVVFGTDSPWLDQKEYLEEIRALDFTEKELRCIEGENAARVLGLG